MTSQCPGRAAQFLELGALSNRGGCRQFGWRAFQGESPRWHGFEVLFLAKAWSCHRLIAADDLQVAALLCEENLCARCLFCGPGEMAFMCKNWLQMREVVLVQGNGIWLGALFFALMCA